MLFINASPYPTGEINLAIWDISDESNNFLGIVNPQEVMHQIAVINSIVIHNDYVIAYGLQEHMQKLGIDLSINGKCCKELYKQRDLVDAACSIGYRWQHFGRNAGENAYITRFLWQAKN